MKALALLILQATGTKTIMICTTISLCVLIAFIPQRICAQEAEPWPQFQQTSQNDGLISGSFVEENPTVNWYSHVWHAGSTGIETPVLLADGKAFVQAGNLLVAYDAVTGETIWKQTVPGYPHFQTSPPAYMDNKLFIATFDGHIRAFDASDGKMQWEHDISVVLFQCPITCYDGYLYVGQGGSGGGSNSYFCLDTDGNIIWEYSSETVGYLWSGASVIGDYLVFANHDAVLTSLNRHDGTLVDTLDLYSLEADAGKARASVSYKDGFVYTTSESGLHSGYIWKTGININTGMLNPETGWHNPIGFSTSTPVIHDGKVYVGEGEHGTTGSMVCLDDATGTELWRYPVPGGVKNSPAVSLNDGEVRVHFHTSMDDGNVYCLSGNGILVWQWDPPGDTAYILQGVSLGYNQVYIGTCSGYVYCLDDGSRSWDINKDGKTNVLDLIRTGNCFGNTGNAGWLREDVNNDGTVNILDMVVIGNHWGD